MNTVKIAARDAATRTRDDRQQPGPRARAARFVAPRCVRQLVVLDLARLEFCDSSGITALIAARNHAVAAGADVALAAVPADTLRVLRIVRLDQYLSRPDARTRPPATAPPPRQPGQHPRHGPLTTTLRHRRRARVGSPGTDTPSETSPAVSLTLARMRLQLGRAAAGRGPPARRTRQQRRRAPSSGSVLHGYPAPG